MYPDESSLSLVYCWEVITCLDDIYCLVCVIASDCMINGFYSNLPCLSIWLPCMWFFSFCDDHQFIDVRLVPAWAGSRFVDFLLGLWPMYWLVLNLNCIIVGVCILCVLASWCASRILFYNFWISLRSDSILRTFARKIILCDVSFK